MSRRNPAQPRQQAEQKRRETSMQATRWIAAAALALAGATVVAAQNVPAERPTKEQREAVRAQTFAQADADGNGALSPDELTTFKTLLRQRYKGDHFARIDANGDGQVTLEEMQAARAGKRGCKHEAPDA
jgi:hypothetical protein